MGSRLSNPKIQYSDDAGNPLPEGKLYFYDSGTTNYRTTYADSGLSIANSNPVILDGAGRVPSIFLEGNYRAILTDKDDNQVWELDPVTGSSGAAQFSDWLITTTYVLNDIVRGSDGKYYLSITNSNLSNDPTSSAANWSEMVFITMWNLNQTYNDNEIVIYNGLMYSSLQGNNLNKPPITEPAYWAQIGGIVDAANYLINANLNTTIVNQDVFAGGQPAAGVYGYDMWKGDALGTRIEQVVENTEVINEIFTISWVGGTGTSDVDGTTGLNSGDSFTLNTTANFSVIVPTDATYIVLNKGDVAVPFPYVSPQQNLIECQRYYEKSYDQDVAPATATLNGASVFTCNQTGNSTIARQDAGGSIPFKVTKRAVPSVTLYSFDGTSGSGTEGTSTNILANVARTGTSSTQVFIHSGVSVSVDRYFYQWVADARL